MSVEPVIILGRLVNVFNVSLSVRPYCGGVTRPWCCLSLSFTSQSGIR